MINKSQVFPNDDKEKRFPSQSTMIMPGFKESEAGTNEDNWDSFRELNIPKYNKIVCCKQETTFGSSILNQNAIKVKQELGRVISTNQQSNPFLSYYEAGLSDECDNDILQDTESVDKNTLHFSSF